MEAGATVAADTTLLLTTTFLVAFETEIVVGKKLVTTGVVLLATVDTPGPKMSSSEVSNCPKI